MYQKRHTRYTKIGAEGTPKEVQKVHQKRYRRCTKGGVKGSPKEVPTEGLMGNGHPQNTTRYNLTKSQTQTKNNSPNQYLERHLTIIPGAAYRVGLDQ